MDSIRSSICNHWAADAKPHNGRANSFLLNLLSKNMGLSGCCSLEGPRRVSVAAYELRPHARHPAANAAPSRGVASATSKSQYASERKTVRPGRITAGKSLPTTSDSKTSKPANVMTPGTCDFVVAGQKSKSRQPWDSRLCDMVRTQISSYRFSRTRETVSNTSACTKPAAPPEDYNFSGKPAENRLPSVRSVAESFVRRRNRVSMPAGRGERPSIRSPFRPAEQWQVEGCIGLVDRWKSVKPNSRFCVRRMPSTDVNRSQEASFDSCSGGSRKPGFVMRRRELFAKKPVDKQKEKICVRPHCEQRSSSVSQLDDSSKNSGIAPMERHVPSANVPSNLEAEECAFFKSECKANPRFHYLNPRLVQHTLALYQKPDETLLPLAVRVIEAFLQLYTSETRHLEDHGGEVLTVEETRTAFQRYIDELKLTELIQIRFAHNTVSPTAITHDPRTGVSTVTVGLPVEYRRNKIGGVLNHEIGTHFIRKYNDRLQPWAHCRRKFQLGNCIATEEGLASINQLYELVLFFRRDCRGVGNRPHRLSLPIQAGHILLYMLHGEPNVLRGTLFVPQQIRGRPTTKVQNVSSGEARHGGHGRRRRLLQGQSIFRGGGQDPPETPRNRLEAHARRKALHRRSCKVRN